ncbi:MAG: creatininase family protein [Acidobacteriota bacterium]|nr:creatininase family protein [Blastocatellia bacterium]MDW8240964.1 creatininase family protein [Acidobacteriota bacterium]
MRYAELTADEIRGLDKRATVLMLPLGSCEQHGRHLPVLSDTIIVTRIAEAVEQRFPTQIALVPTVWVGSSSSHRRFAGAVSLDAVSYAQYLRDLCQSFIRDGFRKILLLNGHGGNIDPAKVALRMIKDAHPEVIVVLASYWELAEAVIQAIRESRPGGIGHACELETSLLLFLAPGLVNLEKATSGGQFRESKYLGRDIYEASRVYVAVDHDELSPSGVYGDPTKASKEKGERLFNGIVAALGEFIEEFQSW